LKPGTPLADVRGSEALIPDHDREGVVPNGPLTDVPPVRCSSSPCSPVHNSRSSPGGLLARGSVQSRGLSGEIIFHFIQQALLMRLVLFGKRLAKLLEKLALLARQLAGNFHVHLHEQVSPPTAL